MAPPCVCQMHEDTALPTEGEGTRESFREAILDDSRQESEAHLAAGANRAKGFCVLTCVILVALVIVFAHWSGAL